MASPVPPDVDPRLVLDTTASPPQITLRGNWAQTDGLPDAQAIAARLPAGADLKVLADQVGHWDTSIAAFVRSLEAAVGAGGGRLIAGQLPPGVARLLALIRASTAPPASVPVQRTWLESIGRGAMHLVERAQAWMAVAGLSVIALLRFIGGRARVPMSDFLEQLVECGPRGLPIVTLLTFLIGAITAFVGVVQLRMFGAELYVADLVGQGMLLEMGALMTAIIMSGRAGASFAAALGTMQTNEEVDALQTLGFDPVEFLVMPRILALTLVAPLLTLYADMLGILGGLFVGVTMLDMSATTYLVETASTLHLADAVKGLIKGTTYGALIGFAGCLRGIECGRSAQAVGQATTSAVVTSIVLIVIADSFLTVLYFVFDGML